MEKDIVREFFISFRGRNYPRGEVVVVNKVSVLMQGLVSLISSYFIGCLYTGTVPRVMMDMWLSLDGHLKVAA